MSLPPLPHATDRSIGIHDCARRALAAHDTVLGIERRVAPLGLVDYVLAKLPIQGPFDQKRLRAVYDADHELSQLYQRHAVGNWLPWQILDRGLSTSTTQSLVGGRHDPVEQLITPVSVVATAGVRIISGIVAGSLHIPLIDGASSAQWIFEGNTAVQSEPSFKLLTIEPKTLAVTVTVSRELLLQAGPALEGVLREHLGRAIGEEIDRAILAGNGVNPQPLGILNHPDVPVVSIGANGGAISWSALAEADRLAMAGARGNQPGAWIMNDKVVKALRTTPRGSGLDFIMPGRDLFGRTVLVSEHVPSNLTKGTGTNLSALVGGAWREAVLAFWGPGLDVRVNGYTRAREGLIDIIAMIDVGFGLTRPAAFAKITDIVTT